MGWTYSPCWPNRAALLHYLRSPERIGSHAKLLRSSALGNHHWFVYELQDGQRVIGLDLMASGRSDGWGYKSLSEDMGPVACDCPLALLELAGKARGHAHEWRERVREYHRRRAARPKAAVGLVVTYGGRRYRLLEPAGPRRGWRVRCLDDGCEYRMRARQLSEALDQAAGADEIHSQAA